VAIEDDAMDPGVEISDLPLQLRVEAVEEGVEDTLLFLLLATELLLRLRKLDPVKGGITQEVPGPGSLETTRNEKGWAMSIMGGIGWPAKAGWQSMFSRGSREDGFGCRSCTIKSAMSTSRPSGMSYLQAHTSFMITLVLSPSNGRKPQAMTKSMTPKDQTSEMNTS
jgi:hypothetical protein